MCSVSVGGAEHSWKWILMMAADPDYVDAVLWAFWRACIATAAGLVAFVFLLWLGSLIGLV
jgi:hypothetical protein